RQHHRRAERLGIDRGDEGEPVLRAGRAGRHHAGDPRRPGMAAHRADARRQPASAEQSGRAIDVLLLLVANLSSFRSRCCSFWTILSIMKIVDARVIVCCPGRNFVTLKLTTEDGVSGLGDATLNGRELAVARYLEQHVIPLLVGRDARRIEDTWHYLYKGAYWRGGPVTMTAIAAVDTALWDLQGKAVGVPVYQLLGGRARDRVLVYGHASGGDIDETARAATHSVELGDDDTRADAGAS